MTLLLSTLLTLVVGELAARFYWSRFDGMCLTSTENVLNAFYPELVKPQRDRPSASDGSFDILFLGGSVLDPYFSQAERELSELISFHGNRAVRIYNLAKPAHTSRDSWLKYEALENCRFDLVVVYDGINDARANNIPPNLYRSDYSHYFWYEAVNSLRQYHGTARFSLPCTLHYLCITLRQQFLADKYISIHGPRQEWLKYGKDLRSAVSFRDNLQRILTTAERRGDKVMLMTFATYVPENYGYGRFMAKQLDYGLHISPIETWGAVPYVEAAVAAHNQVVREVAARSDRQVLFVDQAEVMKGNAAYFNDICHFSVAGSSRFVKHLFDGFWASK